MKSWEITKKDQIIIFNFWSINIVINFCFDQISFYLRVGPLTGFGPQDLIEKSFYDFIHTEDILNMRDTHITCKYM